MDPSDLKRDQELQFVDGTGKGNKIRCLSKQAKTNSMSPFLKYM